MPPSQYSNSAPPLSGRYLRLAEREEIALCRAQGLGVCAVARKIGRAASTVSRELRRNAATRSGGFEYRATTAQWHANRPFESAKYLSIKYTERLAEAKIAPSVGSVGDSYDNALAETINGLFKAEVIHRRGPWRNFEAVEYATLEWVDWFNNRRLLEPIGNIPPAEAEANFYAALETEIMAA